MSEEIEEHEVYSCLYEPVYVLGVPVKTLIITLLSHIGFCFVFILAFNKMFNLIVCMLISIVIASVSFLIILVWLRRQYKFEGEHWRESVKFRENIPFSKLYKDNRAFLPEVNYKE